ncbi:exportin-T-like [Hibiscus syriacus]|uniref:exportin-T-like n=1 Tax=Hibiscus syriacus TaxID=106335 RepID=UPI001923A3F1|nr:exportin-T-like [Hibiscus syriacus]
MACLECIDDKMCAVLDGPPFIKNKLSQVLVTLIYFEYPLIWSSVFVDFLPHLSKGAVVIDMFSRILNALVDELVSVDYPRTPEEVAVAARVKDAMRNQCVPQIVRAWYVIVSMHRNSDPEICATVLDCMRRYVSWIDIGLIVNDAFIPLLFELILVDGIAALITGYAVEVLECSKRVNSEDGKLVSAELLDEVLPTVFYAMQTCEMDAAFSIVQFLSGYVATMKTVSPLQENKMLHISQILEVIPNAIISSSNKNVEEVEVALSLLYALGESMSDEAMRVGNGLLSELVTNLLSTRFPCHSNRVVALVYLETIARYMKFIQENVLYLPLLLAAFLDERGIHHPNIYVSHRTSYLFMRVVKLLKSKLVPFIETILQNLQDVVARFTSMSFASKEPTGSEDGAHIFKREKLSFSLVGRENRHPFPTPIAIAGHRSRKWWPFISLVERLLRPVQRMKGSRRRGSTEASATDVWPSGINGGG